MCTRCWPGPREGEARDRRSPSQAPGPGTERRGQQTFHDGSGHRADHRLGFPLGHRRSEPLPALQVCRRLRWTDAAPPRLGRGRLEWPDLQMRRYARAVSSSHTAEPADRRSSTPRSLSIRSPQTSRRSYGGTSRSTRYSARRLATVIPLALARRGHHTDFQQPNMVSPSYSDHGSCINPGNLHRDLPTKLRQQEAV